MKLIDKDKVVAEIEKRLETISNTSCNNDRQFAAILGGQHFELKNLVQFLDTLEVKEVDLEKEIYDAEKRFGDIDEMGGYRILLFDDEFRDILRHFYELGLKAKGE